MSFFFCPQAVAHAIGYLAVASFVIRQSCLVYSVHATRKEGRQTLRQLGKGSSTATRKVAVYAGDIWVETTIPGKDILFYLVAPLFWCMSGEMQRCSYQVANLDLLVQSDRCPKKRIQMVPPQIYTTLDTFWVRQTTSPIVMGAYRWPVCQTALWL